MEAEARSLESMLLVQAKPGSSPSANKLMDHEKCGPTSKYCLDSLHAELNSSCPEAIFSDSFFRCDYKHAVEAEAVTNEEWVCLVGSDVVPDSRAQNCNKNFMQTMLGAGTASVPRELRRDYAQYLTSANDDIGTAIKMR
eukprot:3699556-Rhodomonas_salina.2